MSSNISRGGGESLYIMNGCSNHCEHDRAMFDYYATEPKAAEWLLKIEPDLSDNIWECACGEHALSNIFINAGKNVRCSDIIARCDNIEVLDFLSVTDPCHNFDIVTNPPYDKGLSFVEHALSLVDEGRYVCMFLKLSFLEGKERRKFYDKYPPIRVWVSSSRIKCFRNGSMTDKYSSAVCYAWFVWKKGFIGNPEIHWFN